MTSKPRLSHLGQHPLLRIIVAGAMCSRDADTVLNMQTGWIQRKSAMLQHAAQIRESLLLAENVSEFEFKFTLRSRLCQGVAIDGR
jgi:hypothetical protein